MPNSPVLPNPMLLPDPECEMHIRYGEPVDVGPPDENPSEERVLKVFEMYKAALQEVFDKHNDTCLPHEVAARGLTIVWRDNSEEGSVPPMHSSL